MNASSITLGKKPKDRQDEHDIAVSISRKLNLRIVLFCFLLFIVNYLDRVNVGFAALTMNADLGFTAKEFGFGAGVFFFGYILFEIPSNMILFKVGPRVWLARIMVTWGVVSCLMATINSPTSFYIYRFLLGLAEAGFAPGVILYMTHWFPRKERGKAVAGFMLATVLSSVIGAPLSGWILTASHGWLNLAGWRWMFILEGVPSILLGLYTVFHLVDSPEKDTRWLSEQERCWLMTRLAEEKADLAQTANHNFRAIFSDPKMWVLTLIYMFNAIAVYGVVLWLPQIVKTMGGLTNFQTGLVSAIPFIFASAGLVLVSRSSDRTGERKWHTAGCLLVGGVFLFASALASSPLLAFVLLCIAAAGIWATLGVFWTLPNQLIVGAAAAGGIAMINGLAQVGGFLGPYMVGLIKSATNSFPMALLALAAGPVIAFLLCMTLRIPRD
ncbi:MFS transporter [Bordetella sp. FB-8]|uniref:MFS transporter n=1 Tax=Bordetella sp. FB-8 TaxID=1159870 RepID=UPI00037A6418|nr:MFS transporter [Bordetella sp. FB-8]